MLKPRAKISCSCFRRAERRASETHAMRAVAPRPLAAASRRRASDLARGPRARPAAAARPRAPRARAASAASAASAAGAVSAASARAGASSSPRADVVPDAFRYAAIASSRAGGGGGGGGGGGAPRVATNAAAAAAASASPSEKKILVAYQGVPGAYSEAAALEAYPTCEPRPCEQFEDAFEVRALPAPRSALRSSARARPSSTVRRRDATRRDARDRRGPILATRTRRDSVARVPPPPPPPPSPRFRPLRRAVAVDVAVPRARARADPTLTPVRSIDPSRARSIEAAAVRLLPIRPRSRCERRSLRTFPVVTLHPHFPFNVRLTGKTFD